MRAMLALVVGMCALSSAAAGQSGVRSASLPDRTPQHPAPSVTTLRSASLPDRSPTQPIPPAGSDLFRAAPNQYAPHFDRLLHRGRHGFPIGFGTGYGPYFVASEPVVEMAPAPRNGYLHLQLQPGHAQVYVDGYYMGSVDDFRRIVPGRALPAGAHRVDLRARGYEPLSFDVVIAPNETISFCDDLRREGGTVTARSNTPGPPKTFYVIPGCYAGDKPPRTRLPRGCDRAKLRVVPPEPVLSAKR